MDGAQEGGRVQRSRAEQGFQEEGEACLELGQDRRQGKLSASGSPAVRGFVEDEGPQGVGSAGYGHACLGGRIHGALACLRGIGNGKLRAEHDLARVGREPAQEAGRPGQAIQAGHGHTHGRACRHHGQHVLDAGAVEQGAPADGVCLRGLAGLQEAGVDADGKAVDRLLGARLGELGEKFLPQGALLGRVGFEHVCGGLEEHEVLQKMPVQG